MRFDSGRVTACRSPGFHTGYRRTGWCGVGQSPKRQIRFQTCRSGSGSVFVCYFKIHI